MLDSLISAPPDSIAFSQRMRQVSEQWAVSAGAVVLESVVLVSAGLAVPGVLAVTGFGSVPLVVVVSEEEPSATGLGWPNNLLCPQEDPSCEPGRPSGGSSEWVVS